MAKGFKKPNIGATAAPELQFMSEDTIAAEQQAEEAAAVPASASMLKGKAPEGYKVNPLYVELKNKRVQLVMQPSLYEKVKAAAAAEGISFNECCHRLLYKALEE